MKNKKSNTERKLLNFCNEVKLHFEFLCSGYGYRLTKELPTLVKYESSSAFINIYHGRLSYELNVEFGVMQSPVILSLSEVVACIDRAGIASPIPYQTSTKEGVKRGVKHLASVVREQCTSLILGKEKVFSQLEIEINKHRANETNKMIDEPNREKAEKAWKSKNLGEVVLRYESMVGPLTKAEKNRLDFAKKKQGAAR